MRTRQLGTIKGWSHDRLTCRGRVAGTGVAHGATALIYQLLLLAALGVLYI